MGCCTSSSQQVIGIEKSSDKRGERDQKDVEVVDANVPADQHEEVVSPPVAAESSKGPDLRCAASPSAVQQEEKKEPEAAATPGTVIDPGSPTSSGKGKGKGKGPPPPKGGPSREQMKKEESIRSQRHKEEVRQGRMESDASQIVDWSAWQSLEPCDVGQRLPWKSLVQAQDVKGSSGSGGITLMQLESGAVCVKPGASASQIIADALADALHIRVARCRVLNWREEEFGEVSDAQRDLMARNPTQKSDVSQFEKDRLDAMERGERASVSGSSLCTVMELIKGSEFTGEQARDALVRPAESLLKDLGRLGALDSVLNNNDRIPLPIWDKSGNLTNVMVTEGGASLVGIDNLVWPITDEAGAEKYLHRLHDFVLAVTHSKGAAIEPIAGGVAALLRTVLAEECLAELSDDSALFVLEGLREGFSSVSALCESKMLDQCLEQAQADVKERLSDSSGGAGEISAEEVASFVARAAQTVCRALQHSSDSPSVSPSILNL
eukprot:TRINITY_DN39200_c0_g2_i1.p1 TRINITY_DN39200_c0_g2~~TRINITY_DN39200_c0_g2_i1.p1  ORF type:complete len:495 (+),score=124.01 TRINITY_DN39200_c0_g2_i1:90-1574(+)